MLRSLVGSEMCIRDSSWMVKRRKQIYFQMVIDVFFFVFFPATSASYHCSSCRLVFTASSSVKRHKAKLQCSNSNTLCQIVHNHDLVEKDLPTMALAMAWMKESGLENFFSVSQSRPVYRRLLCRQRKKESNSESMLTTIKQEDCSAYLNITKVVTCHCKGQPFTQSDRCHSFSEVYRVSGCKAHSHDLEMRNARLSAGNRSLIENLLNICLLYTSPSPRDS